MSGVQTISLLFLVTDRADGLIAFTVGLLFFADAGDGRYELITGSEIFFGVGAIAIFFAGGWGWKVLPFVDGRLTGRIIGLATKTDLRFFRGQQFDKSSFKRLFNSSSEFT